MNNKFYLALVFFIIVAFSFCNKLHSATLFPHIAGASTPNPVGSGARATGMGGAFIAVADDATAASWNPAGIVQLERPELSIVGAYFHRTEDFSSDVHQEINNKGSIDEFDLNYFSATYPFQLINKNMVASINYQRLYEFKRELDYHYDYSVEGENLFQDKHFEQEGFLGALGLAAAIQITPGISLGATVNIWTDELWWDNGWEANFMEHGVGFEESVQLTTDNNITETYSDFKGYNANFGLLWNMNEHLTLGAVVKTPFKASIRREFSSRSRSVYGPPKNETTINSKNITEIDVSLDMPLSYGVGFAWRHSDTLSFALDIYRTQWSDYIYTDAEGNQFCPIDGRPKSESDVEDTTQIRLGGEYLFIGKEAVVPLRGGLFYDPQPSEGSPEDFYGISVGSGIGYKRMVFDMAYQLRWGRDVDTGNLIYTSKADITQHLLLTSVIVHF